MAAAVAELLGTAAAILDANHWVPVRVEQGCSIAARAAAVWLPTRPGRRGWDSREAGSAGLRRVDDGPPVPPLRCCCSRHTAKSRMRRWVRAEAAAAEAALSCRMGPRGSGIAPRRRAASAALRWSILTGEGNLLFIRSAAIKTLPPGLAFGGRGGVRAPRGRLCCCLALGGAAVGHGAPQGPPGAAPSSVGVGHPRRPPRRSRPPRLRHLVVSFLPRPPRSLSSCWRRETARAEGRRETWGCTCWWGRMIARLELDPCAASTRQPARTRSAAVGFF